jgi:abhydrolase domain-containing protein 6
MFETVRRILRLDRRAGGYRRAPSLILVNGLAEQHESWFFSRERWQRHFDVHAPGFLVYDGPVLQDRLKRGQRITVDYLTDRLTEYLEGFVQKPPYHLVASSLGGQISVEYAARHPDKVGRIVLLCPSGMGGPERLPIVEGARHHDYDRLVSSTFYDRKRVTPAVVSYYEQKFASKAWRKALFQTVRGTKSHSVREKLSLVQSPTLVVCGRQDQIVDSNQVEGAVRGLPNFRFEMIDRCGHAPQLECPHLINPMVESFLLEDAPVPPRRPTAPRAEQEEREAELVQS